MSIVTSWDLKGEIDKMIDKEIYDYGKEAYKSMLTRLGETVHECIVCGEIYGNDTNFPICPKCFEVLKEVILERRES